MPKITKPLTDIEIKKSKPTDKVNKLSDGNGLYLVIRPNGTKFFRFDYQFDNKRKSMSFGVYPEVSLKEARELREKTKKLIKDDIDPIEQKKNKALEIKTTFSSIAEKWLLIMQVEWKEITLNKARSRLVQHVYPYIGNKDIKNISRLDILQIAEKMQENNIYELTARILNNIERIFKYAVTYGFVDHNIVADIDKRNILKKKDVQHVPALTKESDIKVLMEDISNFANLYRSDISTIYALKIAPYVFLRPFNLRFLEWSEVDFENNLLDISAKKMKMKQDFILPLSKKAIEILEKIKLYSFEKSKYVFPSPTSNLKAMSENTLNHAIMKMGYKHEMTLHGFRSMFSTIAHEKIDQHGFHSDIIEACLAHGEQNKVKAAYNRINKMKYFKEKKALVEWWGKWLLLK